MLKVIPPGSFDFGMPAARLVDIHSRGWDAGWVEKRAAAMTKEIGELRPKAGHSLIHLISLGSQEGIGNNRNGDFWTEKRSEYFAPYPEPGGPRSLTPISCLPDLHPTFLTHASVYRHHANSSKDLSIGDIKAAAYNWDMRRGELIIEVENDHPEWKDEIQKLASGGEVGFSMAFRVPADYCSACLKRSRSRSEYCPHLRDQMTQVTKEGHQIAAGNDHGVFIDISKVFKPADRIAWSLSKVAELRSSADGVLGGAALAEALGLSDDAQRVAPDRRMRKIAVARKLADLEKRITASAQGKDNPHLADLRGAPDKPVHEKAMEDLRSCSMCGTLEALQDARICLSPRDFFRAVLGKKYEKVAGVMGVVEGLLPGLYSGMSEDRLAACAGSGDYDSGRGEANKAAALAARHMASEHSLSESWTARRTSHAAVSGAQKSAAIFKECASPEARLLAEEFAKYQISFAASANDPFIDLMAVLTNRVSR